MNDTPITFESLREFSGVQVIGFHLSLERTPYVDVRINEKLLDCDASWDMLALVASANQPGGYYLGTCGCGAAGCAGVLHPILVRHESELITWSVPIPYVGGDGSDVMTVRFSAAQYKLQAQALFADFKKAYMDDTVSMLDCYPVTMPKALLSEAEKGWPGWGGCVPLGG